MYHPAEDVHLRLMVIRTENIVFTVVSEFEISILTNVSTWNNDIEYIFIIPQATSPSDPTKWHYTSHHILTIKEKNSQIKTKF